MWSTDKGRPCPHCEGTFYSYSPVGGNSQKWRADCYGCGQKHYFKYPNVVRNKHGGYDCTAAEVSAAHRSVKEIEMY